MSKKKQLEVKTLSSDVLLNEYYIRLEWRKLETLKKWTRRRSVRINESDSEMNRCLEELERRGMVFSMDGMRIS